MLLVMTVSDAGHIIFFIFFYKFMRTSEQTVNIYMVIQHPAWFVYGECGVDKLILFLIFFQMFF